MTFVQKVLELVQFLTLPLEIILNELRVSFGDLVPLHLPRGGIGQQIQSFEIVCRRRDRLGGRRRHELPQRCRDHASQIMARDLFMEHPKLDFGNQRNRGRGCSTIDRRQSLRGACNDEHIVFPSNRVLAFRADKMKEPTLRRHLQKLVEAGLIIRRDSPNGKRYATTTAMDLSRQRSDSI
jgi:hypothetical protein